MDYTNIRITDYHAEPDSWHYLYTRAADAQAFAVKVDSGNDRFHAISVWIVASDVEAYWEFVYHVFNFYDRPMRLVCRIKDGRLTSGTI